MAGNAYHLQSELPSTGSSVGSCCFVSFSWVVCCGSFRTLLAPTTFLDRTGQGSKTTRRFGLKLESVHWEPGGSNSSDTGRPEGVVAAAGSNQATTLRQRRPPGTHCGLLWVTRLNHAEKRVELAPNCGLVGNRLSMTIESFRSTELACPTP